MGLLYSKDNKNNTLNINACSGGIYKTYEESWFNSFNLKSCMAENLFKPNESTIILQMILCGKDEVIAELIDKEDLDKHLEREKWED